MYRSKAVIPAALALLLAAPVLLHAQQSTDDSTPAPQRIEMTVTGLSCPLCAYGLEQKLRRQLEGVDSVHVDLETGKVLILIRDGRKAPDERLERLVRDAGFVVRRIERSTDD
jgi:mercuric ion binding protein